MRIFAAIAASFFMFPIALAAQVWVMGEEAYLTGDYATALEELLPYAREGNIETQLVIASIYEDAEGGFLDYAEAVRWYRLAAEQGSAYAQTALGFNYSNGVGVSQDYAEALRWYRAAALQGHAHGQLKLGVMYRDGQGVLQDNVLAHMWVNIAASHGAAPIALFRDSLSERMTTADISEAQRRARVCMDSDYTDCD